MNKAAITTIAILATSPLVWAAGPAPGRGARSDDPASQVKSQIAAKVLYDGLALTPAQKTTLAAQIREMRDQRDRKSAEREARQQEMLAALEAARDEVYQTGAVSAATRQRLADLRQERTRTGGANAREAGASIKQDLEAILTPEQIEYLRRFDAMRELGIERKRAARREGEAGRENVAGRAQERLSQLSDEDYSARKQQILDRARERFTQNGVEDVDGRVQELGNKLDVLRSGDAAELAKLDQDLDLPRLMGKERERHGRMERRHHGAFRLLGSDAFLALLEGRDPRTGTH